MNVAHFLETSARRSPGGRRWSSGTASSPTRSSIGRPAGWRPASPAPGSGRGAVCLHLANRPEFVLAYYGCRNSGDAGRAERHVRARGLRYIIADSEAAAILDARRASRQLPEAGETPTVRMRVGTGEPGAIGFEALAAHPPIRAVDGDREDLAGILYTSATTGRPKGVMLTHANVVSNTHATVHHLRMTPADAGLCALPLFHCFGQNFIMNALVAAGGTMILQERFVPADFLTAIARHRVTILYAVPTMYILLLAGDLAAHDLSSLRLSFSAAAMLPAEVEARWTAATGLPVSQGYGLTESSPFATYNHEHSPRPGSVGTPIENVEVRVVDEQDREVPDGTLGEIVIRGPNVMQGYLGKPEDTAWALRGGWLHSGDIGRRDEDGYFYVVDRVKDMVNVAGFKVFPGRSRRCSSSTRRWPRPRCWAGPTRSRARSSARAWSCGPGTRPRRTISSTGAGGGSPPTGAGRGGFLRRLPRARPGRSSRRT